ncbi:MAG: glycosyltransferase [Deltaproteobacteria bacterium]|nr:glycosyltransferase [Deltaproteobacteria bacterium]
MRLSIIIPTLNEAPSIVQTLTRIRQEGECELVVVDGGSEDRTTELAQAHADRVVLASRGRARQMNAGAGEASGDALVFLHADTKPPPRFLQVLTHAFSDPQIVGGRFDVRLDAEGWPFRMIETMMNLRSRLTKISTGDQAIFVRRQTFHEIGGFPDLALMEDIEFSRRLKRAGKIACLQEQVVTSARRWQQDGVFRTIVRMWTLRLCYFFGVPAERLREFYADTR